MNISNDEIAYIVQEVCRRVSASGSAGHGADLPSADVPAAGMPSAGVPVAGGTCSTPGGCATCATCSSDGQSLGSFSSVGDAVAAALVAQKALIGLGLERRKDLVAAMRTAILADVENIGRMAVEETGLGRVPDKVKKVALSASKTPGPEDIEAVAFTGDRGLTLTELAPFGVIGAITPSTNPAETVVNNSIAMLSAGNAVVFNCHPSAKRVSRHTVELLNKAIIKAGGPPNVLCVIAEPTKESSDDLMRHPSIRLLTVTGGPEIVGIAMNSGKRVIAAGPGNPPVVVDETADLDNAARCIYDGASFDNNVLCIAEKEVFCVAEVFEGLMDRLVRLGAVKLTREQSRLLTEAVLLKDKAGRWTANKKYVGKDIQVILKAIHLEVPPTARLAVFEATKDCPLVVTEQLMPVLPIVRCKDVGEAIAQGVAAEGGCHHTAMMHSRNVDSLTQMARAVDTSIFVKNGPSYAGLGFGGEGFNSFTIATPTGEGVTSPVSYTRKRRCVLTDSFRIV